MSSAPGPHTRPSASRNGIVASVPWATPLFRCPSASTWPDFCEPPGRWNSQRKMTAEGAARKCLYARDIGHLGGAVIDEPIHRGRVVARQLTFDQLAK